MKKRLWLITALSLALLLCLGTPAQATDHVYDNFKDYGLAVSRMASVQSKSASAQDSAATRILVRGKQAIDLSPYAPLRVIEGPGHRYTAQFATKEAALFCMDALSKNGNLIYLQQDGLMSAGDAEAAMHELPEAPSDARAQAAPRGYNFMSWGVEAMGAESLAASIKTAGSITVAVVDSGVGQHPLLNSRVKTGGLDFINPANKDGRSDGYGHGTHVSGTIVDMTPGLKVNILPVRVLGDDGIGASSIVASGVLYAAESGAKVINMSLGGPCFSSTYVDVIEDAIAYAQEKGAIVVLSSGNDNRDTRLNVPARMQNAIVVAALNSQSERASFSNYGASVDVAAPGLGIRSCAPGGGYAVMDGTSMATPHISAIVAMLRLQNPSHNLSRIENALRTHCVDLGAPGWDKFFGYGMPRFGGGDSLTLNDYVYKAVDGEATILSYTGSEPKLVIPETLGGLKVTRIGQRAFQNNLTLTAVTVPGTVEIINADAFRGCVKLTDVTLGEGVRSLGTMAFRECTALVNIALPQSLTAIDTQAFDSCTSLVSIDLPKNLTTLGSYVFTLNTALTRVVLPGSLKEVGTAMFDGCTALTEVVLQEGIQSIDPVAFRNCTALASIKAPASLTSVRSGAFHSCEALASVSLPSVTRIEYSAFINCTQLERVDIPKVRAIERSAFAKCAVLTQVTLPETLEELEGSVFAASGLQHVTLPKSLTQLGEDAFKACASLQSATILGDGAALPSGVFADCPKLAEVTLRVPRLRFTRDCFTGSPLVVIHGYEDSDVHDAAQIMGIPFASIGYQFPMTKLTATASLAMIPYERLEASTLYTFAPVNASCPLLVWTSSDPSVVTYEMFEDVEGYHCLTALNPGKATVTGTAQDGSGLSITIEVTVAEWIVTAIRLEKSSLSLLPGDTAQLIATVMPEEAPIKDLTFHSENETVATVDIAGLVTAHKAGSTSIVVEAADGSGTQSTCFVRVRETPLPEPDAAFTVTKLDDGTGAITGFTGAQREVVIPGEVDGLVISAIGARAFKGAAFEDVTLPGSVTTIEAGAFVNCKRLKSISLPRGLLHLAPDAFKGCKKLPKVKTLSFRLTDAGYGRFILTPVFSPSNTAAAYTLTASPKKMAQISGGSTIRPNAEGRVTLTLKSGSKSARLAFEDGLPYAATKISIAGKKARTLRMGKELALSWSVVPASAQVIATWTADKPDVATVTQDGVVTPVGPGKTKIRITTESGLSAFVTVEVKPEKKK